MNISKASRGRSPSGVKSHVSDENARTNSENKYEGKIAWVSDLDTNDKHM